MRIRILLPVLLLLVAAGTAPLAGQSNAVRILNDRYTRSHDYDLVHQRIELRNFDWSARSLDGRVTATLVSLRAGLDSVILDAGALLEIRTVTGTDGATGARSAPLSLEFTHRGDTLVVRLPRPVAFHDTVRIGIEYHARIENGHGLTFIAADSVLGRPQQIWSQGQTDNNHDWFPTYDFPNDKLTWDMVVTVPAGFTAVSNGTLVADTPEGDAARTMHWRQAEPASSYLASLIVAPLVAVHDEWRDVPVTYYVYRADSALAEPLFGVTPDMIEVYSDLTGVPYPWAKYAQTTVADFFGGMENVSASTMVDWLPDERAYRDRPWYRHILIPHELAHQWFGDLVTVENWANMWLNEGFAEFMPGQYWAVKHGAHAEDEYYLDEYQQFMRIDARRRMPLASDGSNNIYPKGALVLQMLKQQLGEERFWASVHRYLTRHAYDNAVSDDFRQAVLDATGQNLAWFWDRWVYAAGYPELTVTAAYDSSAGRVTLVVRQTQQDTATPDSTGLRYRTPEVFRMPVTIRVGTERGDLVERTWLDQRQDTVVIDDVTSPPTMVVYDDENAILKELTFDQPTAWLATQLAEADELWNRWWAVRQLAERTGDPAAARALARAVRSADYFSTRAAAASALEGFPGEQALPALEAALADTSAEVREAAAGALLGIGGERALALARRAWETDSSYEVRARALAAVARLDSTGSHEAILQGLRTDSYRDVIQNAAIAAVIGADDPALVDSVAALIGEQDFPAFALGVMAARGDARALDVLTQHLDDERPAVRRWVLQAFERAMPTDLAVRRLRAVVTSLSRPEARAAVREALEVLDTRSEAD